MKNNHSNNYHESINPSFLSLAVPGLGQYMQEEKKLDWLLWPLRLV